MIGPPLELRPGVKVQYHAADSDEWREGKLVKNSVNREEWLVGVKHDFDVLHGDGTEVRTLLSVRSHVDGAG